MRLHNWHHDIQISNSSMTCITMETARSPKSGFDHRQILLNARLRCESTFTINKGNVIVIRSKHCHKTIGVLHPVRCTPIRPLWLSISTDSYDVAKTKHSCPSICHHLTRRAIVRTLVCTRATFAAPHSAHFARRKHVDDPHTRKPRTRELALNRNEIALTRSALGERPVIVTDAERLADVGNCNASHMLHIHKPYHMFINECICIGPVTFVCSQNNINTHQTRQNICDAADRCPTYAA